MFLANMRFQRPRTPRLKPEPRQARAKASGFTPVVWRQLPLFELDPDSELIKERALAADSDLIGYCKEVVRDHAARHGWSKRQRNDVIRSLRLLQVLQDTPGAKVNATDLIRRMYWPGNPMSKRTSGNANSKVPVSLSRISSSGLIC